MFIDTHCHITDSRFDGDRDKVISHSREKGVNTLIEVGCNPADWKKAIDLTAENQNIFCVLGIHPQDAKTASEIFFNELEDFLKLPKVVGIGETGLDYYYENSPREIQKNVFTTHMELYARTGKPVVIHCRNAYDDLIKILEAEKNASQGYRGVIHCFSGSLPEAVRLAELGFFLGIDGPVTYPKAKDLREVVEKMPLDKLLLETDSPYLPPQPFRGERNEPSYLPLIAEEIARVKNISKEMVGEITGSNAKRLFSI